MADAPPIWEDKDARDEEQHNAWNHVLEFFTFQGSSTRIQQCMKEEKLCKIALTCHFAFDVTYMSVES